MSSPFIIVLCVYQVFISELVYHGIAPIYRVSAGAARVSALSLVLLPRFAA